MFPTVPRNFWRRFDKRWGHSLSMFEKTITLAQSFGADPHATYYSSEGDDYWFALRSLHSRTCLQARARARPVSERVGRSSMGAMAG